MSNEHISSVLERVIPKLSVPSQEASQTTVSKPSPILHWNFKCSRCGVAKDVRFGNEPVRTDWLCPNCKIRRWGVEFEKICPALYFDTDPSRLPQNQLKRVLQWQYGPKGLVLTGATGTGKTRCAWLLINRIKLEDEKPVSFMWFDAIGFGHDVARHYRDEDAESWLKKVAETDLVFFDDLGKLKLTERAETELFGVIERRCANKLPMLITTNDTGDSLGGRMTDNRGPALIRRLREFCETVCF